MPPEPRPRTTYAIPWKWTPGALLYLLVGFVLSVASFVVLVPLLSAGVGTLIIWIGIPLIVGMLFAARGFATAQCYLLGLTGLPRIRDPDWDRGAPAARTWWTRLVLPLRGGHY